MRRFRACKCVDQVTGPTIGNDHAAQRDQEQGWKAPDAESIVPVEIPGLSLDFEVRQEDRLKSREGPPARPPDVQPRDGQQAERQVAGARNRTGDRPVLAFRAEPAVPVHDLTEEIADGDIAFPADVPGIGVDEDGFRTAESHDVRLGRIGADGNRGGCCFGLDVPDSREYRVEIQSFRSGMGRMNSSVIPIGVIDDLALEGEQHAGYGHDQNDHAGDDTRREMYPEDGFT